MNLLIMAAASIVLLVIIIIFITLITENDITLNEVIGFIVIIVPIIIIILNSVSSEQTKKVFVKHTIMTEQETRYTDLFECEFPLDIGTISKFDCYTEDRVYEGSISRIKRTEYTVVKTDSNYIITVN